MGQRVTFLPFMLPRTERVAVLKVTYQNHSSPSSSERQYVPLVLIFILPIPHSSEYQFMLNTPSQFMQICACSFVQLDWIACTCANYASKCGCVRALNYSKCYLLYVGWGEKRLFILLAATVICFEPQSSGRFLQICMHKIDFHRAANPSQMAKELI